MAPQTYDDGGPIVRRGLLEHFEWMRPHGVCLFTWFLLVAGWRKGELGVVTATVSEIAAGAMMTRRKAIKTLRLLRSHGLIEVIQQGRRFQPTQYRIPKYRISDNGGENARSEERESTRNGELYGGVKAQSEEPLSTVTVADKHIDGGVNAPVMADNQLSISSLQASKSKHKRKHTEGFDEWYASYPRKIAKARAEKAFQKVVTSALVFDVLMRNTRAWAKADFSGRPLDKIPYPASFLNSRDWQEAPPSGEREEVNPNRVATRICAGCGRDVDDCECEGGFRPTYTKPGATA